MAIVSELVDTAQQQLAMAAESQFGATAGAVGTVIQVASYLAIVGLFANGLLQLKYIWVGDMLVLVVKLLLIAQFATVWREFNIVADAVISGMNEIASIMILGDDGSGASLATAFDTMLQKLADGANKTIGSLGMFASAIMSAVFLFLQAIVAAAAGLVLIFALIMITIHIGLAPIFIAFSIFDVTKDLFYRWLQSTFSYTLYPVVIAGVIGSIIKLTEGVIDRVSASSITSLASLMPFIVVLVIMIATILLIPMIVTGLSGAISAPGPLSTLAVAAGITRNVQGTAAGARAIGTAGRATANRISELGGRTAAMARGESYEAVRNQTAEARRAQRDRDNRDR